MNAGEKDRTAFCELFERHVRPGSPFAAGPDRVASLCWRLATEDFLGKKLPADFGIRFGDAETAWTSLGSAGSGTGAWVRRVKGGDGVPLIFFHGDYNWGSVYTRKMSGSFTGRPLDLAGLPEVLSEPTPVLWDGLVGQVWEAVRAVHPSGPYLLGGFCNGGFAAVEVAARLETAGERVLGVALVDPDFFMFPVPVPVRILQRLVGHSTKRSFLWKLFGEQAWDLYKRRYRRLRPAHGLLQMVRDSRLEVDPEVGLRLLEEVRERNRTYAWMMAGLKLPKVRAPLTVWNSEERLADEGNKRRRKQEERLGKIRAFRTVPGRHMEMDDEFLGRDLAEWADEACRYASS
jgi:hypothetical protein